MRALMAAEGANELVREFENLRTTMWKDQDLVVHGAARKLFVKDLELTRNIGDLELFTGNL
jgi:hypothetical protein